MKEVEALVGRAECPAFNRPSMALISHRNNLTSIIGPGNWLPHKLAVKTAPTGYKADLRRLKQPAKAGFVDCSRDFNRRKSQNFATEPGLDEFPGSG